MRKFTVMLLVNFSVSLLIISTSILTTGCTMTRTVYVEPEYPVLTKPIKVRKLKDTYVQNGCLYIKEKNSNLCDDDLKVVLTQVRNLRINEETCDREISSYNKWVTDQNKTKDSYEYNIGFGW